MKSIMELLDCYSIRVFLNCKVNHTSSLPQSHSSPCSTSPFPHLGLISCKREKCFNSTEKLNADWSPLTDLLSSAAVFIQMSHNTSVV